MQRQGADVKRKAKTLWLIFAAAALVASFQNCSGCSDHRVSFNSGIDESTDSGQGIVGNGEPIDGKPDPGLYYRVIPGFECGGRSMLAGKIQVTATDIQAKIVDPSTCQLNSRQLQLSDLEYTPSNKSYLGLQEGLYEKIDLPAGIEPRPDLKNYQVTEAWCRREPSKAPSARPALDIVVRTDLSTGLLSALLIPASGAPVEHAGIQRRGEPARVSYANGSFSLNIDLASLDSIAPGKTTAHLTAQFGSDSLDEEVLCRTGARLDPIEPTSPPVFKILGATGGTDSDIDAFLTNGTTATVHWQPVAEASSYRIAIQEVGTQAELCARTFTSADSTSQPITGCGLVTGAEYQISAAVTTVYGRVVNSANGPFSFALRPALCPVGYVPVPSLLPYSNRDFCVAKFEAKQQGALASSSPGGIPWVNVNRDEALAACQANGSGFDLISNDEWQTLARDIEAVSDNWSGGGIGVGALSTGHSDGTIPSPLAAPADDTDSCYGTGQACGLHGFNSQKRILQLSNGSLVWDLAGNVWEWTRDDNFISYGANDYMNVISNNAPFTNQAQDKFGPAGSYPSLDTGARGGLGYASINFNNGGIVRGSYWDGGAMSGVFRADTSSLLTARTNRTGFRCVYHLP